MRAGDTIAAIASPSGAAERGVVRLSGPGTGALLERLMRPVPGPGAGATRIDLGAHTLPVLVTRYQAPRSYTGEDAAEILVAGNPHVLERLLNILLAAPGTRHAEPGEFTARAYLAGKLTLLQAEGVAATIAAASTEALSRASSLLAGSTGTTYRAWADELATLLALVEAGIDFTDQEDVVPIAPAALRARLVALDASISSFLGAARAGEARAVTPRVVLAGEPSAGKSTLFNALLGRRRAVTSPVPGTTRDVLEEPLDLSGVMPGAAPVLLADTAGLNEADARHSSAIGAAAQRATSDALRRADAIIHCDPTGRFPALGVSTGTPTIRVRTKADLPRPHGAEGAPCVAVCAFDGWNLQVLRRAIADAAAAGSSGPDVLPRHRRALTEMRAALQDAVTRTGDAALHDPAPMAGALRAALDALGALTGRISPDDVIGRVFSTFCVGK